MTSRTDTFGITTSATYDLGGNVTVSVDGKGKSTTRQFDAADRLTAVVDRLAGQTLYSMDLASNLTSVVDAQGQVTSYTYNDRSLRSSETLPDHVSGSTVGTPGYGIVEFAYDPAGRMLRKTDQTGATVTINYDLASRMTQRDYRTAPNSPSGTIADSDTFQFDAASRMTSATSGRYVNSVSMSYDPTGRLATEGLTIAGQTYSTTREYDVVNRVKKYIYPDGTQVERTYTNRSQLNQIKYNSAVIDTRTYDVGGRLSTSTYSNGAVTTWNYRVSGANKDNLLANITTTNPGANKVGTYTYTWDANRNKTAETISNSPLTGFGFSTGSNGYDNENRVTAWNRSDSNQNQTWNLSLVGDWNTFNQAGTSPFNQTRSHGLAHEFTSFTGTNSGTLTFDTKGNLIARPATLAAPALNLTWDFDNRMSGADTDGTPATNEVTFQYDALGRRVARTESGITTVFVQAGQQTIADYASGAAPSTPTYRYVYADYVDEPAMRETASGNIKHFYHRNQQYSITALTDNSGNTAERYAYTSNGVLTIFNAAGTQISISALFNRYTFTGREWDSSLAMYYFRARWFDPTAGRFTNRDALAYVDGMNLYRGYFGLRSVDPSGQLVRIKDMRSGRRILQNEDFDIPDVSPADPYWDGIDIEVLEMMGNLCPQAKLRLNKDRIVTITNHDEVCNEAFFNDPEKCTQIEGCKCLCGMVDSDKVWTIYPDANDLAANKWVSWPNTDADDEFTGLIQEPRRPGDGTGGKVHIPTSHSEVEYGFYDPAGNIVLQSLQGVFNHEFCGHAWMLAQGLHVDMRGQFRQTGRPDHDQTIIIENELSGEQGLGLQRGLYENSGREESAYRPKGITEWITDVSQEPSQEDFEKLGKGGK